MKLSLVKITVIASIVSAFSANAQVKAPITNNDLRNNLQKIIADFPHQLSSVKGDTLAENPQTIEFSSLLTFEGAQENSILQYKSVKPVYSWNALLVNTEEFDEASKKYKWLYNQLKVMTVSMNGYSFSLDGDFESPDESRKFWSSIFKLTPNAVNMPKLRIEATMQFEFPEWKVNLLVYEKEREDSERGELKDSEEK